MGTRFLKAPTALLRRGESFAPWLKESATAEGKVHPMLDVRRSPPCVWPVSLCPLRHGEFDKEPFLPWWERNRDALSNLHAQIAEQWVHRHWDRSPYTFVPLHEISWVLEDWQVPRILAEIHIPFREFNDPEFDYDALHRNSGFGPTRTAKALDTGTWDFPIIVLRTDTGIRDSDGNHPDSRFLLIEGHQRMRYLNALTTLDRLKHVAPGPHAVFVLKATELS